MHIVCIVNELIDSLSESFTVARSRSESLGVSSVASIVEVFANVT